MSLLRTRIAEDYGSTKGQRFAGRIAFGKIDETPDRPFASFLPNVFDLL